MEHLNYNSMDIWELASRHSIARDHKNYVTCRLIEAAVMKLPHKDQVIASRLNYYAPAGDVVKEIDFNK